MYNHQLETFIRVADAGSFNKAAEESYITPTAIIKQILYDKHGQPHVCIDEYMKRHLEIKLISSIVTKAETG